LKHRLGNEILKTSWGSPHSLGVVVFAAVSRALKSVSASKKITNSKMWEPYKRMVAFLEKSSSVG